MAVTTAWENSKLYKRWDARVNQGAADDFVICVTASSKTGVSGTGKTTLQTKLAQQLDASESGFDAEEQATLDAGELAYEITPNVESKSAVIFDEAQGAPGTTGLDSRRGMKQEVIDAISGILANRDKQLTVIIGAQMLHMLDTRLYGMIDAWLLIRKSPGQIGGPLGTHHKLYIEDYDLGSPDIKTPALEDFRWDKIPHDDPDYQTMERKKQEAKRKQSSGDGEESDPTTIPNAARDKLIKERLQEDSVRQQDIANTFGITRQRVSQIANEN